MKIVKALFYLFTLSIIMSSCTPQALDDDQSNIIENTQATGSENTTTDDGSKD